MSEELGFWISVEIVNTEHEHEDKLRGTWLICCRGCARDKPLCSFPEKNSWLIGYAAMPHIDIMFNVLPNVFESVTHYFTFDWYDLSL
ncbi:hypothetical protein Leryth_009525 [Lithospermum erythrorhizon]|nr:hypothetical protein Leryth_009525 [Lithospermum erythrorhizon]